jgi:phage terminase small subunit
VNGLTLMAQQPAKSDTQEKQLKAYADALRADVKTEKKAILTKAMQFTPEEDKAFWPLYNEYLAELTKLGDERIAIIKVYAENYQKMTNAVAHDLAKRSLAVQKQRTALLEKYYDQMAKVMSPIRAARFLQIENALNMLIDIQVAAEIPLME